MRSPARIKTIQQPASVPHSSAKESIPLAHGQQKFLGNIYSQSQKAGFEAYWNQLSPENAGKWGRVEAVRDSFDWQELDEAYALAKKNGYTYRHHVLIWGNQQPSWIEDLPPQEQLIEIEEWFAAVAKRYPEIDILEVVNEPINDPPNQKGKGGGNYIHALGGSGESGWKWVVESFSLARTYFPKAKLTINEYNILNNQENALAYIRLIELLKSKALVDLVSVQAHAFSTKVKDSTIKANLGLIASTELPISISELDIDGPTDEEQLAQFQKVFPILWEHPSVIGITFWGYRPGMWRSKEKAFLIHEDGLTERPALKWLRTYLKEIKIRE